MMADRARPGRGPRPAGQEVTGPAMVPGSGCRRRLGPAGDTPASWSQGAPAWGAGLCGARPTWGWLVPAARGCQHMPRQQVPWPGSLCGEPCGRELLGPAGAMAGPGPALRGRGQRQGRAGLLPKAPALLLPHPSPPWWPGNRGLGRFPGWREGAREERAAHPLCPVGPGASTAFLPGCCGHPGNTAAPLFPPAPAPTRLPHAPSARSPTC